MLEKEIEAYLRERVKAQGGTAYKWVSPGCVGVPDRMALFPGGLAVFVELKAPGKVSKPHQRTEQARIRQLGFRVYVLDSKAGVDAMLREVLSA